MDSEFTIRNWFARDDEPILLAVVSHLLDSALCQAVDLHLVCLKDGAEGFGVSAMILGFTRAMGEFGATVIVAGNIPGRTQTLSSAIFSAQQSGNEPQANFLLAVALTVGFAAVYITESLSQPRPPAPHSTA